MTVTATVRKAGPFTGNAVQTAFPFAFKIFTKEDIAVIQADLDGAETTLVLDSDYTVALNVDQDNNPGGTVTTTVAPPTNYKLAIIGDLSYTQEMDLTNGGAFLPQVQENAADRTVIEVQQLVEQLSRAVQVPVTSDTDPADLLAELAADAATASAAATAATAAWNAFRGQYYGAYTSDPTTDPLGNPPNAGDLYYNTTTGHLRVYDATSSAWIEQPSSALMTPHVFDGDGVTTDFPLTRSPVSAQNALVFVGGVYQRPTLDYTITGSLKLTLSFTSAPAVGTNNVECLVMSVLPVSSVDASNATTNDGLTNVQASLNARPQIVASVAALRALTDAEIKTPIVFLESYNDGQMQGGGHFAKLATPTSDDSVLTINNADGSSYRRLDRELNFYMGGAQGGGTIDDTTAGQLVFTAALLNYMTVNLPYNTFKGNWTVGSRVKIRGENATLIPAADAAVLATPVTSSSVFLDWQGFTIDGTATQGTYTSQDGIALVCTTASTFIDSVTIGAVQVKNCGRYGLRCFGSSANGPFVQNLMMSEAKFTGCTREGIYFEGDCYEVTFRNVFCTDNGDKTTYSNCTIGSKTNAGHGVNRLTWVGGAVNQFSQMANARYITDAAITSGTANLNSATANFVAGDVGTPVFINGAGAANTEGLITTILSVTDSANVVLNANASTTVSGAKAMVNFPTTGGVNINAGNQITFQGVDFESCGACVIANGALIRNIDIDACNFSSNFPMLAVAWVQAGALQGLRMKNYSVGSTSSLLYGALCAKSDGSALALTQAFNIDVDPPIGANIIAIKTLALYEFQPISSNTVKIYHPATQTLRVASGTLDYIYDKDGGTRGIKHGSLMAVRCYTGSITVESGVGNIQLEGGNNLVIASGGHVVLQWDSVLQFWRYVSHMNTAARRGSFTLSAAATKVNNNVNVQANSVITLMPTNAAAATLMQSTKSLYVSARTAATSFTVATADGTNAAGTETFEYFIS